MARFTQWTVFVTSGKSFPEVRQLAINFLNRAQNASPPEGGDQSLFGLLPSGEVYQNLFAIVQGVQIPPMPDGSAGEDTMTMEGGMMIMTPTDTTRMPDDIRELDYLATVLSDKATEEFTSVPLGVGYLADFQTFVRTTDLTTAIAGIEPPPTAADVGELVIAHDDFISIINTRAAILISQLVDPEQIKASIAEQALESADIPQVIINLETRLYNDIISRDDDILSSVNLRAMREIIDELDATIAALTARVATLETT